MRNRDEIEFSFWLLKGRASGRFAIQVLAALFVFTVLAAMWLRL